MSASDRFVDVPGLTMPVAPLRLALDLEARGLRFALDAGDLLVGPADHLTDADRDDIRRWKRHLIAIVALATESCESWERLP